MLPRISFSFNGVMLPRIYFSFNRTADDILSLHTFEQHHNTIIARRAARRFIPPPEPTFERLF